MYNPSSGNAFKRLIDHLIHYTFLRYAPQIPQTKEHSPRILNHVVRLYFDLQISGQNVGHNSALSSTMANFGGCYGQPFSLWPTFAQAHKGSIHSLDLFCRWSHGRVRFIPEIRIVLDKGTRDVACLGHSTGISSVPSINATG